MMTVTPPAPQSRGKIPAKPLASIATPLDVFVHDVVSLESPDSRKAGFGPIRPLTSSDCFVEMVLQVVQPPGSRSYIICKATTDVHTDIRTLTKALGKFQGTF